jgi:hypothetical protein
MKLSSLIAPGAAILPFGAVLGLCVFLLSLPSGEGARIIDPAGISVPQPIEAPALPRASLEEPSEAGASQVPSVELSAPLPVAASPVMSTGSEVVSMMAAWRAQRPTPPQAGPEKAALSTPQYRRRGNHARFSSGSEARVFRREFGCPPSVCLEPAEKSAAPAAKLPTPRRWVFGEGK